MATPCAPHSAQAGTMCGCAASAGGLTHPMFAWRTRSSHVVFTIYLERRVATSTGEEVRTVVCACMCALCGVCWLDACCTGLHVRQRRDHAPPPRDPCFLPTTPLQVVRSKLHLVDLAGSERTGKTGSEGDTFKEATYINKSLTFLEQVVVALVDKQRDHIPYRQTKLTNVLKARERACARARVVRLLLLLLLPLVVACWVAGRDVRAASRVDTVARAQDSLGGNCRTRVVACVWSTEAQFEETVATLRFATRMMRVKTRPSINYVKQGATGGKGGAR